jgi:hypothetical protein
MIESKKKKRTRVNTKVFLKTKGLLFFLCFDFDPFIFIFLQTIKKNYENEQQHDVDMFY